MIRKLDRPTRVCAKRSYVQDDDDDDDEEEETQKKHEFSSNGGHYRCRSTPLSNGSVTFLCSF